MDARRRSMPTRPGARRSAGGGDRALTDDIVAALKTVYDPEIPADIYELGLIYKVDIDDDRAVTVDMTLTTPELPGRRRDAGHGWRTRSPASPASAR